MLVSHLAGGPLNVHATHCVLLNALHPHLMNDFEIHRHPMMIYLSLLLQNPSILIIHFCFRHHDFIMSHLYLTNPLYSPPDRIPQILLHLLLHSLINLRSQPKQVPI